MNNIDKSEELLPLVEENTKTVSEAKTDLVTTVNKVITKTYWIIGKYIVEFEQDGQIKAKYAEKLKT